MRPPGRPAHLAAGGTTVLHAQPAVLDGVVVGSEAAGQTLALHDCATAGAVAAGNLVSTIKLDARDSFAYGHGAFFAVGITAVVSGGTPDVTVIAG